MTESREEVESGEADGEYAVELEQVSKEYLANGVLLKALDGLTLDIVAKETTVILGPSGAGKTTLLNLISGLEKPSNGKVQVLGVDISTTDENFRAGFRSKKIGFIFQSYNLVSTLTARENVELMMELGGSDDFEQNEKRSELLIQQVGLSNRMNHLPSQLSGGEQQRVAIARALANDPPLILADEPTGNLDSSTGLGIVQLLAELREKRGKTVIITTHDDRIVHSADSICRLDTGRLAGIDRPSRVRN